MVIVKKGYTLLGNIALIAVIIPIFIAIPRMIKQDKADKQMTGGMVHYDRDNLETGIAQL